MIELILLPFTLVTMLNFIDKYYTAYTLQEMNFDKPKSSISKLIDKHELNPIGRWIMHKCGIWMGMGIGFILSEIIMILIIIIQPEITLSFFLIGGFLGSLMVVDLYHFHHISLIESRRKKELSNLRNRFKKRRR